MWAKSGFARRSSGADEKRHADKSLDGSFGGFNTTEVCLGFALSLSWELELQYRHPALKFLSCDFN